MKKSTTPKEVKKETPVALNILAARAFRRGADAAEFAGDFDVPLPTSYRWHLLFRRQGEEALRNLKAPGPPRHTNYEKLRKIYKQGPGQDKERWTVSAFAIAMKEATQKSYCHVQAFRLLRKFREEWKKAHPRNRLIP